MFAVVDRARARAGSERGFFMVWFAVTFVTLTAFAGLALEYNRWQQIATKAQKAADAAALAGAVFMPENVGNKAFDTAQAIATENGFKNGQNGATITTSVGKLPNQLKVTINIVTRNPWGAIVNYGSTTIVKSAVAEYQLPQNLGSPQNIYGNNPEVADFSTQPQFWGNVFGPSSQKTKGDAILSAGPNAAAGLCNSPSDNCPSGVNKDYDANGYFYGIEVPAGTTNPLTVQVFDPAFVHVGDNCSEPGQTNYDQTVFDALTAAASVSAANIPGYPAGDPPSLRYAPGVTKYCTGDMSYSGDGSNNLNPWTVYTLRAPDLSTWDPTNNPILCQAEFPGIYPEKTNDQPNGTADAAGYPHIQSLLQSSANYAGVTPAMPFAKFFRQWVSLCTVNSPVEGTYFLQIQTAKKIDGTATPNGGGANRFSIRAGIGGNYATDNGVHVYGNQKMGIYANETAATTTFYLTRVLPGEAGKTLVINFFDIGDGSSDSTLKVLPPPDSNVGSSFSGCTYTPPPGNSVPPWGSLTATSSTCSVPVTQAGFNGQWITFEVPIPNNYTCTSSSPTGCWLRLSVVFTSGSTQDTTTWNAYILGEPVRLIQ
jgi:Flp pilus assembly protein TadG